MSNITTVLNDQIRRLAKREVTANTKSMKRATGHYRRDIAALKRHVALLTRKVAELQKQIPNPVPAPPAEVVQNARLRIDGLKGHRTRLGLSAKDYGRLMGVSALTIYNWESRQSKPRRSQLPKIVAVRGIGKREAMERLRTAQSKPAAVATISPSTSRRPTRGQFNQTGAQSIFVWLKGRRSMTTREINVAWKKEGRAGTANVLLGKLVRARKLKRTKVKGQRGSQYRVK